MKARDRNRCEVLGVRERQVRTNRLKGCRAQMDQGCWRKKTEEETQRRRVNVRSYNKQVIKQV